MRLRQNSMKMIQKMVEMLHMRDPYTAEHSRQVSELAQDIARELHLPEEKVETIGIGAVVHDIGKIGIPESIVNKPGPLNEDEWALMKKHPLIGVELLSHLEMYGPDAIAIVRHEHEHWDGSGYPDGLKGELIPIGARIVAAADVYNALVTDRPYRESQGRPRSYTPEQAIKVMESMKETILDPKVVDACVAIVQRRYVQQPIWSSSSRRRSSAS
jgi:putative nucleotidyltransferase with HDIG domain